jgi:hypothetical protein
MSPEEHEAMLHMNEFARRYHSEEDVDEDDPNVLLFRSTVWRCCVARLLRG